MRRREPCQGDRLGDDAPRGRADLYASVAADPSPEAQAMAHFMREADRWRAGLPHALSEEQEGALIEAREHGDALVQALRDAGPNADVQHVVNVWAEEYGGHVLAWDPPFAGPDPGDDGDGWEEPF